MRQRADSGNAAVYLTKMAMTVVLVAWWLAGPQVGYASGETAGRCLGGTIWEHLLWPLGHGNVWHLTGNVLCLWWMKGRVRLWSDYAIAVACSWLPVVPGLWEWLAAGEPLRTVGFSGVLCAEVGTRWGEYGRGDASAYRTFIKKVWPFVAVSAVLPHVNWCIHLYCLVVGYAYGRWGR